MTNTKGRVLGLRHSETDGHFVNRVRLGVHRWIEFRRKETSDFTLKMRRLRRARRITSQVTPRPIRHAAWIPRFRFLATETVKIE